MATHIRLGLFYQNNENWIGGTYYVQNLLQALGKLDDADKPFVMVLTNKPDDYAQLQQLTQYPKLEYHTTELNLALWQRVLNRFGRFVRGRNIVEHRPRLDVVFPTSLKWKYFNELVKREIFWIPDFQEEHLPQLFSDDDLAALRRDKGYIVQNGRQLVLSSQAAHRDLERFYKGQIKCRVHVLPFAVTLPDAYKSLNINDLLQKYSLPETYYFAPNQFWKHKNHFLVIQAVEQLKQQGLDVVVAFSGKEHDYRHPNYTKELKQYVESRGLSHNVRFLGFIDRNDQLQLMNHARAIVQPSLFEGWSTVVEDAKALNQFVIASNLDVHREQLPVNGVFFNPLQPATLAHYLAAYWQTPPTIEPLDYQENIRRFGANFLQILQQILPK